jgi:hypothetical protein
VSRSSEGRSIAVIKSTSLSTGVNGSNTSHSIRSMVGNHCRSMKEKFMDVLLHGPQSTNVGDLVGSENQRPRLKESGKHFSDCGD